MKTKFIILISILIIGCKSNETRKTVSLNQIAVKIKDSIIKDSISSYNPQIIDSGYTALKKFKKEIQFGSSNSKFKLEFKDFHPDTTSLSYAYYFFNEKGVVTELSLSEGFIDIKDEKGELKNLRVFPDNDFILLLLEKKIKVGDKINTICTPQGARLVEIVELEVY